MRMLAIEFIVVVLVSIAVLTVAWKLVISKIPAVRVMFKLSDVKEINILSEKASTVDVGKTKNRKQVIDNLTKEKF